MAVGYFDVEGDPRVTVEIVSASGTHHFDFIIDTDFTGFLSLRESEAAKLGLRASGSTRVMFANGAEEPRALCRGTASIDGVSKRGTILLESGGSDALLGIGFLRTFELKLLLDPVAGRIELTPAA